MIQENLSELNNKIVGVRRVGKYLVIKRFDNSEQQIEVNPPEPDCKDDNAGSINYILNQPVVRYVQSLSDITLKKDMDVTVLHDGSEYIYSADMNEWIQIKRSIIDVSTRIAIDRYEDGRKYGKGSVVEVNGLLFSANEDTSLYPLTYGSPWRNITALDMFINRCEVTTPKLYGTLTVSDNNPLVYKEVTISTSQEFYQFFNESDRADQSDIVDGPDGFYLNARGSDVTEMNFFRGIDTSKTLILSVEVNGKTLISDSIGYIWVEMIPDAFMHIENKISSDESTLTEVVVVDREGRSDTELHVVYGAEANFNLLMETAYTEHTYDKINVKYKYSNSTDLSKHSISSIKIRYIEREDD